MFSVMFGQFQSTRPVWGATVRDARRRDFLVISIHAPRVGRDPRAPISLPYTRYFNPRAPCGARPFFAVLAGAGIIFQSTRPVWGATFPRRVRRRRNQTISIHAPRVGRDWSSAAARWALRNFNPRAPCGARQASRGRCSRAQDFNPRAPCGARPSAASARTIAVLFQSTRPVWGATRSSLQCRTRGRHFNPRAPCGARQHRFDLRRQIVVISIHAPRVGRDQRAADSRKPRHISIHAPRVGRDGAGEQFRRGAGISIHAPRVGRDGAVAPPVLSLEDFNPRAPCGARPSSPCTYTTRT